MVGLSSAELPHSPPHISEAAGRAFFFPSLFPLLSSPPPPPPFYFLFLLQTFGAAERIRGLLVFFFFFFHRRHHRCYFLSISPVFLLFPFWILTL